MRGVVTLAMALLMPWTALAEVPRVVSQPYPFTEAYAPGDTFMGLRWLGTLELRPVSIDDQPLVELSGLEWSEDDQILYAVSDTGRLFHLRPVLEDNGRIGEVQGLAGFRLKDSEGKRFRGKFADSEGLAGIRTNDGKAGNSRLAISFERKPRLGEFTPEGRETKQLPLASAHRDIERYRGENKSLEAVTWHPKAGWLTAPEWPLKDEDTYGVRLADNGRFGFARYPAPKCALVAMETLSDGSLLNLERCFSRASATLVVALRRSAPLPEVPDPQALIKVREIAQFDTRGDFAVDNFEGLTKFGKRGFLMVSDDNQNYLQRTLLVHFELVER